MTDSRDKKPGKQRTTDPAATAESSRPQLWKPAREASSVQPKEVGGREGPEPTRFGDWERNGRCIDF